MRQEHMMSRLAKWTSQGISEARSFLSAYKVAIWQLDIDDLIRMEECR